MSRTSNLLKNILKNYVKKAAKEAVKKFVIWLVGAVGVPTLLSIVVGIILFLVIFGAISSSDTSEGPEGILNQNKAQYISEVKDANPNNETPKSTRPELEKKHYLNWGTVFAIDFYRTQYEEKMDIECKANKLAPELAPNYDYRKSKIVTITWTKKTKTVETEDGTKTVTYWDRDKDVDHVYLLTKADTYKGTYTYEYKEVTNRTESSNRRTKTTKDVLNDMHYIPDWSKFDTALARELNIKNITMDDRTLVVETGLGYTKQEKHLSWLMDNHRKPGAILAECPEETRQSFLDAEDKYGIPWHILMAIAKMESSFRADAISEDNYSGEVKKGIMQFLPSTWTEYGLDADNDGEANPFSPKDAIFTMGYYLKEHDGQNDIEQALYEYNDSDSYVEQVMNMSERYKEQKVKGSDSYYWFPVGSIEWRKSSSFGENRDDHVHQGIDIAAEHGTRLRAVVSGEVRISESNKSPHTRGGKELWIYGDDGNNYYYAHLSGYAVTDGEKVNGGELVGYVGNTGKSTGPHLHFGMIIPSQGSDWVDPSHLFEGVL